jgi:hypothetical protein
MRWARTGHIESRPLVWFGGGGVAGLVDGRDGIEAIHKYFPNEDMILRFSSTSTEADTASRCCTYSTAVPLIAQNLTLFAILPIPSTSISTKSPSFKNPFGSMKNPTPLGVPVIITVPFRNVVPRLRCAMICLTVQIISSVPVLCLSSPFTLVVYDSFCGSGIAAASTTAGPIGAKLSKDFA